MRWAVRPGAIFAATLSVAAMLAASAAGAQACDRACLRQTLDRYLAAVVKHDPAAAPLAADDRETEDAVVVKPGDGIWKTASGLGDVQRRYLDPVSGQAAYFGLINEAGASQPALVGMRIKVDHRKVTEAEWFIARKGDPLYNPDGLRSHQPRGDLAPPAERLSRDALLKVGQSYFEALSAHDGKVMVAKDDCMRVENGTRTTGVPFPPPGAGPSTAGPPRPSPYVNCQAHLENLSKAVETVIDRRFPVVDTEAQVVMGIGIFHAADGFTGRDGKPFPRLTLTEFFTVDQGKIATVHAAMFYLPPGAPEATGW